MIINRCGRPLVGWLLNDAYRFFKTRFSAFEPCLDICLVNVGSECGNLNYGSAINNLGIQINPQELNERLREVEGYENGNLIWYKLNETIPSVDYRYSRVFTVKTIENDLKNGLLPIVNVRYHKYGITHWVLIVGAVDGEFIIYDPANTQLSYLPLSTHGKVYAYRVIVKSTDKALNPP